MAGEPTTTDRRGWILRALFCWSIARLRPAGEPSWVKPAWRHYNILHHFYLEGARASALAETMALAEQTLYQLRGQAISALAGVVRSELGAPENHISHQQIVNADRYARLTSQQQQLLRLTAVFPGAAPVALLHALAQTLGNAFEQTNSDESLAHYARAIQLLEAGKATMIAEERLTLLSNIYLAPANRRWPRSIAGRRGWPPTKRGTWNA